MKYRKSIFLILSSFLLISCSAQGCAPKKDQDLSKTKISVISDIHVKPRYMIANTSDYQEFSKHDGKMTLESQAFFDRELEEIKKEKPNVLMISGDLSSWGELEAHQYVAKKLKSFQDDLKKETGSDVQVLLVPGNHDIRNPEAYNFNTPESSENSIGNPDVSYQKREATRTEPDSFFDTYKDVAYTNPNILSFYRDSASYKTQSQKFNKQIVAGYLSYSVRISGKDNSNKGGLTVICIDDNKYSKDNTESQKDQAESNGNITEEQWKWIDDQAKEAKDRGDMVIAMEHHPFLSHFDNSSAKNAISIDESSLLDNHEFAADKFASDGIHYVFTGHMHANDVASYTSTDGSKIYDLETDSLLMYPSAARFFTASYQDQKKQNISLSTMYMDKNRLGNNPITFPSLEDPSKLTSVDDVVSYGYDRNWLSKETVVSKLATINQTLLNSMNGQSLKDYLASKRIKPETLEFLLRSMTAGNDDGGGFQVLYGDFRNDPLYPTEGVKEVDGKTVDDQVWKFIINLDSAGIPYLSGNVVIYCTSSTIIQLMYKVIDEADKKIIRDDAVWQQFAQNVSDKFLDFKLPGYDKTFMDFFGKAFERNTHGSENDKATKTRDPWVDSVYADMAKGKDSQILLGNNGLLPTMNQNNGLTKIAYDLIGNISLDPAIFDTITPDQESDARWGLFKEYLKNNCDPLIKSKNLLDMMFPPLFNKAIEQARQGDESSLMTFIVNTIKDTVKTFVVDDNVPDDLTSSLDINL